MEKFIKYLLTWAPGNEKINTREKIHGRKDPPMELKNYFKSSAVFKKLPDMYKELNALRKEIDEPKKQLNKE